MIYTTLNKIRVCEPCSDGWEKLLKNLGKTKADDEPLSMLEILSSNGLDDAMWCLRAFEGIDSDARLFAVACARRVQHLMTDQSINALDVVERYAHGQATADELCAARDAARSAWDAAGAATWDAAAFAAEDAAALAAEGAAGAAGDAERKWQEQEFKRMFCGDEK